MSEKRFRIENNGGLCQLIDNDNDNTLMYFVEEAIATNSSVVNIYKLLNELHEENEQLKHTIKTYKTGNNLLKTTLDNIKKENTELQEQVDDKEIAVEVETEILMKKILEIIDNKISILEHDLDQAVKAGMSGTSIMYSEIEMLDELKRLVQE